MLCARHDAMRGAKKKRARRRGRPIYQQATPNAVTKHRADRSEDEVLAIGVVLRQRRIGNGIRELEPGSEV
jgi:hypothetical protein